MAKIRFTAWMASIPSVLLLVLLAFFWFVTGFNTIIAYLIVITALLLIYILTYTYEELLFEFGESSLPSDDELLNLEKDNAGLLWGYISAIGIAFLLSGMSKIAVNPLEAVIGLTFLIVGNLIFEVLYYPRYAFLIRRRKIKIMQKEKSGQ